MSYNRLKRIRIVVLILQVLVAGSCAVFAFMAIGGNGPFSGRDGMPLILGLVITLFCCHLVAYLLTKAMQRREQAGQHNA